MIVLDNIKTTTQAKCQGLSSVSVSSFFLGLEESQEARPRSRQTARPISQEALSRSRQAARPISQEARRPLPRRPSNTHLNTTSSRDPAQHTLDHESVPAYLNCVSAEKPCLLDSARGPTFDRSTYFSDSGRQSEATGLPIPDFSQGNH